MPLWLNQEVLLHQPPAPPFLISQTLRCVVKIYYFSYLIFTGRTDFHQDNFPHVYKVPSQVIILNVTQWSRGGGGTTTTQNYIFI